MRNILHKILLFTLTLACVAGCMSAAGAAEVPEVSVFPCASDYFDAWRYEASAAGNGDIYIYFKVTSTRTMTSLGVSSIAIYKELPNNAGYTMVHSYNRYNTPSLLGSGTMYHSFSTTYDAVVGEKYYASFAFYAANSSGSETQYRSTAVITIT